MTEREKQDVVDAEHLKLLRVGYIVAGVADAFFALFPLIYVLFGFFIAVAAPGPSRPGDINPAAFGMIFALVGLGVSAFFALQAVLKLLAARAIGRREARALCYVAAGLSCLQMPWGTALGVFTFMTIGRDSVRERFDGKRAELSPPPERMSSTLFDEERVEHP